MFVAGQLRVHMQDVLGVCGSGGWDPLATVFLGPEERARDLRNPPRAGIWPPRTSGK